MPRERFQVVRAFIRYFVNLPTKLLPNNFFTNKFVKMCNNVY